MVMLLLALTVATLVTIDACRARRASRASDDLTASESGRREVLERCA